MLVIGDLDAYAVRISDGRKISLTRDELSQPGLMSLIESR